MERMYLTGNMVDQKAADEVGDVARLEHAHPRPRRQSPGLRRGLRYEGRPFSRHWDLLLKITEAALQVHEPGDYPVPNLPTVDLTERLTHASEAKVSIGVRDNVFGCGYSLTANRPSIWGDDDPTEPPEPGDVAHPG